MPLGIFRGAHWKWEMDEEGATDAGGSVTLPAGCDIVVRCPIRPALPSPASNCGQHGKKAGIPLL